MTEAPWSWALIWPYVMAVGSAALVLCVLRSDWLKAVRVAWRLDGPPALPLLGNVLTITNHEELIRLGRDAYDIYGKVFRVWMTMFPMFVVSAPDDVQAILSSYKHTEKISLYKLLHNFVGEGLITSGGEEWHVHRKLVQPCFHITTLERFLVTFHEYSKAFVDKLRPTGPGGMNITSSVNTCVLNILNETVLGISSTRHMKDETQETPFRKGEVTAQYRIVRPWLLLSWVYSFTESAKREMKQKNELMEFTKKMIQIRRKDKERMSISNEEQKPKQCLLDFLISVSETHKNFTEKDIANEICTFMLAGQDSVGAALAFAIFLLAKHQDVQQRVVDELEAIFQGTDRVPTRHDLAAMRYLEQCLKETLRLYPSVPMVARRLTDDVNMGKDTLPKGAEVLICPFAIHQLKHIYPNPQKYDPNRFSPENVEGRHPYTFIPFSAGPRNCIGYKFALMEMKTVMSELLRRFHLSPVPGKDEIDLKYRLTLRSRGGVWVRLSPRQTSRPHNVT